MNRKRRYRKIPAIPPLKVQYHTTYYPAQPYLSKPRRIHPNSETSFPLSQLSLISRCHSSDNASDDGINFWREVSLSTIPGAFRSMSSASRSPPTGRWQRWTLSSKRLRSHGNTFCCWGSKGYRLQEKAAVQIKASWQAELAHRWNWMTCTIINNILLHLQGFQTHHKDGWQTHVFAVANACSRLHGQKF